MILTDLWYQWFCHHTFLSEVHLPFAPMAREKGNVHRSDNTSILPVMYPFLFFLFMLKTYRFLASSCWPEPGSRNSCLPNRNLLPQQSLLTHTKPTTSKLLTAIPTHHNRSSSSKLALWTISSDSRNMHHHNLQSHGVSLDHYRQAWRSTLV